jgi:hypothetical protein
MNIEIGPNLAGVLAGLVTTILGGLGWGQYRRFRNGRSTPPPMNDTDPQAPRSKVPHKKPPCPGDPE